MSDQLIPLDNSPNQIFQVPLNIDGLVRTVIVNLRYNEIAKYWVATIQDNNGALILDSIPLLTGDFPAANILGQFAYLGIGSIYVLNPSSIIEPDSPDNTDLGTDFQFAWSDTPA